MECFLPLNNRNLQNFLVVNDSESRRSELVSALSSAGYPVESIDVASVGRLISARALLAGLVVLDIELLGNSSLQLVENLRNAYPHVGIVVVSNLLRTEDRLQAYRKGADIYLQSKPDDAQESAVLVAAVKALAYRMFRQQSTMNKVVLDVREFRLYGPMATVDISAQECHILSAFADTSDLRLETQHLIEIAAKAGTKTSKSTLEVQLVRLRKKLATVGADSPTIKAMRGFGYQLCVPVMVVKARG
jgi:DNA-binding response OmpR family regulator